MPSRSPIYVSEILAPCFEVAKRRFYAAIMEVNLAHALMLDRRGIIPREAARAIAGALMKRLDRPPESGYDPRYEDLFFLIEAQVAAEIGEEAAGHMHVAFSRNDLDAAIFRMALRCDVLTLVEKLQAVREAILRLAAGHVETVMPAYTHNQQAQPTTLAHYLMALEANLRRDTERLLGLYERVNRSPMGAAALSTTGFPIDRQMVAAYLGFTGLVANAYDAVSASDHMLEATAAVLIMASGLSRFVHDLLLLASNEFDVLRLDDSLVQISSIMPQKRNPVALEHLRAVLSRVMGRASGVFPLAHNVPLGDINDVGDDLQPMLEELFRESNRALDLLQEILGKVSFDAALLERRVREGFATVTELADTLVREAGLPFRQAHQVVSKYVDSLRHAGLDLSAGQLEELDRIATELTGRPTGLTVKAYQQAIDPHIFVRRRAIPGGPAPEEIRRALGEAQASLARCRQEAERHRTQIQSARSRLLSDARSLAAG